MIGHDTSHDTSHDTATEVRVGTFSAYRCACGELFTGTPTVARQRWRDHATKMAALTRR